MLFSELGIAHAVRIAGKVFRFHSDSFRHSLLGGGKSIELSHEGFEEASQLWRAPNRCSALDTDRLLAIMMAHP
jgi:hypothetical protein